MPEYRVDRKRVPWARATPRPMMRRRHAARQLSGCEGGVIMTPTAWGKQVSRGCSLPCIAPRRRPDVRLGREVAKEHEAAEANRRFVMQPSAHFNHKYSRPAGVARGLATMQGLGRYQSKHFKTRRPKTLLPAASSLFLRCTTGGLS